MILILWKLPHTLWILRTYAYFECCTVSFFCEIKIGFVYFHEIKYGSLYLDEIKFWNLKSFRNFFIFLMLTWGPATPANNIIFPPDASQREMQNAGPKNGPGMTTHFWIDNIFLSFSVSVIELLNRNLSENFKSS